MIVCSLGYGYTAMFLLKELCAHGVRSIGITSNKKKIKSNSIDNLKLYPREKTEFAISKATHLIITAPPSKIGCPILLQYFKFIAKSNINSVVYISTTGVYGNHNGNLVDETSTIKGKNILDKNRIYSEMQWNKFCKNNQIKLNIIRLGSIYGPSRCNSFKGKHREVIIKKNHFFSRIHIYDISRIITKILLEGYSDEIWNVVDNEPSSREDYLREIIKLKKIKNFKNVDFLDVQKSMKKNTKKYWTNNKRVDNSKIRYKLSFTFLFPSYREGLKNLIREL